MKHQRFKSFIFYSNYDPGLTLTYFMASPNFENMTLMNSLEIITSCDLKLVKIVTWICKWRTMSKKAVGMLSHFYPGCVCFVLSLRSDIR